MADYQSDSDDEVFNPAPHQEEDDHEDDEATDNAPQKVAAAPDSDNDDEDEEDDEANNNAHQKVVAAPASDNDDEDEDNEENDDDEEDEEEEEEEDDEDAVVARPAKRRKKKRNQFIDVEAEVDEEDEEEEDDDEIPDEIHPDDLEPTDADRDDRAHRQFDIQRQVRLDKDAEQIAKEYDEKYRQRENKSARRGAYGAQVHAPAPSVNDPSIWAVKVRPGKEREVIMAIQKRIDETVRAGQQSKLYAAFERGGTMTGYIYVEADAKNDMIEVIENIPNVFMGQSQMSIPVKERQDLLRKRRRTPLEEGKFVRMVRPPLYKGDLAKIVEVHQNGLDCTVQLVPRLDYGLGEDANAAVDGKRKRPAFGRNVERPPQKLFNDSEARKKHMKHLTQVGAGNQRAFTYKNEDYQNGFLLKEVKVNQVSSVNVNPRMEEMQFFSVTAADGTETLDLIAVQAAQKAATTGAAFVNGDTVEIYEGEQKGLRGTTVTVTGDIVTIKVTEGELKGRRIDAPVRTLRKLFREGDHVKVIGGSKYIDEVGLITRIKVDKVTLLCDSTQTEITVFSKDLKRAADSATLGDDSKYNIYDMVRIDASTIAIVIKVDREVLKVIDQNAETRTLLHTQVSDYYDNNRNAVATDRDGSEIRMDDTVKEHGGESRQGRVHHIHRGALFVTNREILENAGVFVVRSSNVVTMAAKSGRTQAAGPDLSGMNPALQTQNGGIGGGAMAPPTARPQLGRDRLIGKTVTIRKGVYKGLLGIVKGTMNDEARIELHTKNKQVTVKKDVLTIKDPLTGNSVDVGGGRFPGRPRGGGFGGATPGTGRTPSWGGAPPRGPSWGGATPSGGRTPGWGGGGGRTPGWGGGGDGGRTAYGGATAYGGGDGSRTAYGGDGSRTAYGGGGDGSRTAYGGATAYGGSSTNDGSRTAYGGAGGRTPGWGGGGSGSTPASRSNLSAPTPGGYNAPTPAPYSAPTPTGYGTYSAPTPGAPPMDAPTPGTYSASTPGYGGYAAATPTAAPTPGAWAETPGGDDDAQDPHYD